MEKKRNAPSFNAEADYGSISNLNSIITHKESQVVNEGDPNLVKIFMFL